MQLPPRVAASIRQEDFSPEWPNRVRSIYKEIDQAMPSDQIALNFLASLKKHSLSYSGFLRRQHCWLRLFNNSRESWSCCHGDIHAGNVLMAQDGRLYIVDWDQPIMASKERDLMFIGGGVGNVWNNQREIELFYTGYGETRINKTMHRLL